MRLFYILILSALLSVLVPMSVSADTQGEAVAEGAVSALGNAMRDIGLDISGGSLPAIEHIFSNWKNLRNPCGNARKLIMAMLRDSNSSSLAQPDGTAFADVMVNVFDLPRSSAATLAVQGEIISKRLWGKYKLRKRLRDVLFEIHRMCTKPKKPRAQVTTGASGATGVSGGDSGTTPLPPAPKPKPQPETKPKPEPVKVWTVDKPCPECQPVADKLAAEKAKLTKLQAALSDLKKQASKNKQQQKDTSTKITELQTRIDSQKGTFAESTDPATGIRIRSENIGGGKVRITTTYPDGRVETRERDSSSAKKLKEKIKKLEQELKKLKEEETRLNEQIKDINKQIKDTEINIKQLQKALEDCVREKCNKGKVPETAGLIPGGGEPVKPSTPACTPTLVHKPVAIGPKSEIGGGISKMIRDKAKGLIGGALGGLLGGGGGGISFGGGGDELADAGDSGPDLFSDPVENKQSFTVPGTDIRVSVGAKFDTDGKFLVSSKIEEASGKPTFHDITLHDTGCMQARPIALYPYGIYTEWSLEMKTIYYKCGDGGCVKTHETDWETIDSGKIAEYGLFSAGDGKDTYPGIWSQFYDSAEGGIDAIGAKFNVEYKNFDNPFVVSLKYTQPDLDPVLAAPLNLMTCPEEDGEISLIPVKEFLELRNFFDGGGTRIDPPKNPELLQQGAGGEVDSVAGDLQPYTFGGPQAPDTHDQNTPDQMVTTDEHKYASAARTGIRSPFLYLSNICPKWVRHEEADARRWESGDRDQAGEDFMNAFLYAFGGGKDNIDEWKSDDYYPYDDGF